MSPPPDLSTKLPDDPVVVRDGVQYLRLDDGTEAPLLDGVGVPLRHFTPGWVPVALYSGFKPFLVLEFEGVGGARVCWLLDGGLRRLGDALGALTAEQQAALIGRAVPVLRRMMTDILVAPLPVLSAEAQGFARIPAGLRMAIANGAAKMVLAAPLVRLAGEIEESVAFAAPFDTAGAGTAGARLSRRHIEAGFAVDFEDRLVEATRRGGVHAGMLSWPSPIDGRPLRCQGCLYFDDFRFAYRFADGAANLTFYVIAADHYFRALGIYVPALDLLVVRDGWSKHLVEVFFPPDLSPWLVRQVSRHAEALVGTLTRGAGRIASVMRGPPGTHLGHQLWNELSGIEYLLTSAQESAQGSARGSEIPEWIIPGAAQGVELWAPTETLFPELAGRVNRGLQGEAEVAAYVLAQDICAVRVTRKRVSVELRRRLMEIARADPVHGGIRDLVTRARARGAPVIMLGLRVENRTLVDLAGFFEAAIALVGRGWPGAILVIDGHNLHGSGAVIESHGERLAARAPLEVEREVALALRAQAAGLDVEIVDTLGCSLATSLGWAEQCDCFLSIWGASLAKFRWVANKPGLVLTSRANLLDRDDLHIYDRAAYMDTPSKLVFVDPASVVDDKEAATLVPVAAGSRFFANFRVDHARVLGQLRDLVNEVMTAR